MMRNKVIWLMGGTGSGKTTVSKIFKDLGLCVIDADKISREILKKDKPAYLEVTKAFGGEYLLPDGSIDRRKLGAAVFSDREKLETLNKITHKYIKLEINRQIEESENCVLVDAALLPNEFCECDRIVFVTAPAHIRAERIIKRDSVSKSAALDRISAQPSDGEYAKVADFCIENTGSLPELKEKIIKWCLDEKII